MKKKNVKHLTLQFDMAYKSEERVAGLQLEAKCTELTKRVRLLRGGNYIYRPYNQGFNHFALLLQYVSTDISEVVDIAEEVSQEIKDEFRFYCYSIY